jgi:hypothetical protein
MNYKSFTRTLGEKSEISDYNEFAKVDLYVLSIVFHWSKPINFQLNNNS